MHILGKKPTLYISVYLPLNSLNSISEISIFHHWQVKQFTWKYKMK